VSDPAGADAAFVARIAGLAIPSMLPVTLRGRQADAPEGRDTTGAMPALAMENLE